jgi:transcription elongation factor Elf1
MNIICPYCGSVNRVDNIDGSRFYTEVVCKKCGSKQELEIGAISFHSSGMERRIDPDRAIDDEKIDEDDGINEDIADAVAVLDENTPKIRTKHYKLLTVTAAFLVLVMVVVFIGGVVFTMRGSGAYGLSKSFVRNSDEIKAFVGDDMRFGKLPTGFISTSGEQGKAKIDIKVEGDRNSTVVRVMLRKVGGKWKVMAATYEDEQGSNRLILGDI